GVTGIDAFVQIAVRSDLDPGTRNGPHEVGAFLGVVAGDVERPRHLLAREHVDETRDTAFGGIAAMRSRPKGQLVAAALQRRAVEIKRKANNTTRAVGPGVLGALGERGHRTTSMFQKRGLRPCQGGYSPSGLEYAETMTREH